MVSPISEPLDISIGPYDLKSSLVLTSNCQENLLGLDLLKRLHATIFCFPDGVYVTLGPRTTKACYLSRSGSLPPELAAVRGQYGKKETQTWVSFRYPLLLSSLR